MPSKLMKSNLVSSEVIPVDSSQIFETSDLETIQSVAIDSEDREKHCFQHDNEHLKKENADLKSDIDASKTVNNQLKKNNDNLIKELNKMTKKMRMQDKMVQKQTKEKVYEILRPVFTIGQIKKLLNPNKKAIKWNSDDIATAIALRSVTPKGYRYLRKKNYPLPALSTLRKKAAEIMIEPGVLEEVLSVMKSKEKDLSSQEKICVLAFDELYISQDIEIDRKKEKTVGPHKTVQVGMARGLFSNWKQPVYYGYDQPLTADIVKETISKLYDVGYTVVALTTDLGPTNSAMHTQLNIRIAENKSCCFAHPSDSNLKVFVFADPPHLLKLIRNNYIDSGFTYFNAVLTKKVLEEVLLINQNDLKIAYKIEQKHIDCTGTERQKVSLAAQVFSHSTAEAVRYLGDTNLINYNEYYYLCADLFEDTNQWFDLFNSKVKYGKTEVACAYGVNLEKQGHVLQKMNHLMNNIQVGNHKTLLPFQKGVLLSNASLEQLLKYLQEKYNTESFQVQYLLTNRLNQDVVENFSSYIRGMGSGHDKPSALQFMYRLKWYILGKHCRDMFVSKANTEEDLDTTLVHDVTTNNKKTKTTKVLNDATMGEILGFMYDHEIIEFMNVSYSVDDEGTR